MGSRADRRRGWTRRRRSWPRFATTSGSSIRPRRTRSGQKKEQRPGPRSRGRLMAEALFQISEPGQSRIKAACRTRAVGIDLGTTNSLVAVVASGEPLAVDDEHGEVIVPSVVHYAADGGVV